MVDDAAGSTRIIILNYRTPALVVDCLASLADEVRALTATSVVVVDNGSGDDSVDVIGAALRVHGWEAWASLLPLSDNLGFAGGNNVAIQAALSSRQPPDWLLLLNSDTLIRPGAVQALLAWGAALPQAGIIGARLEDPDGAPQASAFRFPSLGGEIEAGLGMAVASRALARWRMPLPISEASGWADWTPGACMLIRRAVFETIGLFDTGYFMYYEDVDFCLRARRAGWRCWHAPDSRVVHLVGRSRQSEEGHVAHRLPPAWFVSRRRYFLKHHGPAYTALCDATRLVSEAVGRTKRALRPATNDVLPLSLADLWRYSPFGQEPRP